MRIGKILFLIALILCNNAFAGKKLKVLFIGNSYIYVNNMPQILADIAKSMGDTLIWDIEAPGGFSLGAHYQYSPPTINKIKAGGWNYVVLQEQSQAPALPDKQVNNGMFPFARKLDSLIDIYNSCAETIFYMTWGRKNGDTFNCVPYSVNFAWPYFCTYNAMDSMIRIRYMKMADSNQGIVSPAGAVWRYIRNNHPGIELYDTDESHPSQAGSYAVACCFYATLFQKNPATISYNYTLSSTDALNIKAAAKTVVYDSMLYWHIGQYRQRANFTYTISGTTVNFMNTSVNAHSYIWHFGDGLTSIQVNPSHTYTAAGAYTVTNIVTDTNTLCSDTLYALINIYPTDITQHPNNLVFEISPNPVQESLQVTSKLFTKNKYILRVQNQWGQVIYNAETLPDRSQHINITGNPPGIYLISVIKDGQILHSRKLVKQ